MFIQSSDPYLVDKLETSQAPTQTYNFLKNESFEDSGLSAVDLFGSKKKKPARPSAVEMRARTGNDGTSKNVPKNQRNSDADLLQIGLNSIMKLARS